MKVVGFSIILFVSVLLLHWCWWRLHPPKRQIATLLALFLASLPVGILIVLLVPGARPFGPDSFWEGLHAALFHAAVSLAYISTFSAIEKDSPTLTIMRDVANAGEKGRSRAELLGLINSDATIGERFDAMLAGGWIAAQGDAIVLTAKGRSWARIFGAVRRLYGLNKGG